MTKLTIRSLQRISTHWKGNFKWQLKWRLMITTRKRLWPRWWWRWLWQMKLSSWLAGCNSPFSARPMCAVSNKSKAENIMFGFSMHRHIVTRKKQYILKKNELFFSPLINELFDLKNVVKKWKLPVTFSCSLQRWLQIACLPINSQKPKDIQSNIT